MARNFTDALSRDWTVAVDVNSLKRVRATCNVDLANLESLDPLADDPLLLFDCLVAILQPQFEKAGITAEQFATAFHGDSAGAAGEALVEALIDFFPEPKRSALREARKVAKESQEKMLAVVMAKLKLAAESAEQKVEADIESRLSELMSGNSFTAAPASPDLTQAR